MLIPSVIPSVMGGDAEEREPGAGCMDRARRMPEEVSHLAGSFAPPSLQVSLRMTIVCRILRK